MARSSVASLENWTGEFKDFHFELPAQRPIVVADPNLIFRRLRPLGWKTS